MKKNYIKPTMEVVIIQPTCILSGSDGSGVNGMRGVGGDMQLSRHRFDDWDEGFDDDW